MSNSELLRETQRAAGAQNLSTWHEQLIVDGKALKGLEQVSEIFPPPLVPPPGEKDLTDDRAGL